MQVIADLHGGDTEDLVARAEFQEIKERVLFDVSDFFPPEFRPKCYYLSERTEKIALTRRCGSATSGVYS